MACYRPGSRTAMYEAFYGLNEKPFALLPDPSFLYMSKGHRAALTMLRYSLRSRQGFTVVSGEVGCGKTTLINLLLDEMDDDLTVGLINFTQGGFGDLAEWVNMSYGLDYKNMSQVELYERFVEFLIAEYATGRQTVLIIDEAQNMGIHGLENVRMLSNVNAQKDYLLHLILVGQPELQTLLRLRQLRQLTQRVSVSYHLNTLSQKDSKAYVLHRIKVAGGDPGLFSPNALTLLVEAADGVPRIINNLCDLALVYGYSADKKSIDVRIVRSVLRDRYQMGLPSGQQMKSSDSVQAV